MNASSTGTVQTLTESPPSGRGSTRRLPLIAPLLVVSLTVHAALVGLWPFGSNTPSTPMTAGPLSVRLQTTQTADARRDTSRSATAASPSPAPSRPRPPVGNAVAPVQKVIAPAAAATRVTASASPVAPVSSPAASAPTDISRQTDTLAVAHTTATATVSRADNVTAAQVNSSLKRALIAHFDYPMLARRRGWEGIVRVGVRVEANGHLSGLRIVASSGHALLDRAAMKSLRQVDSLNDTVQWLNGRHFDMVLPVHYRLIDS